MEETDVTPTKERSDLGRPLNLPDAKLFSFVCLCFMFVFVCFVFCVLCVLCFVFMFCVYVLCLCFVWYCEEMGSPPTESVARYKTLPFNCQADKQPARTIYSAFWPFCAARQEKVYLCSTTARHKVFCAAWRVSPP